MRRRLLVVLFAADFFAAGLRRVVFLRVVFFAVDFLAAGLRRVVFLRVVFFAADFFAAGLRRVVFLRVVFLAAGLRRVVLRFLVAAAFFAAVERFALFRFLVAAAFFAEVDLFLAGDMVTSFPSESGRHALQASPFPFAHPSPHAVPLVTAKRVVQTLDANRTVSADPFRLPR